MKDKFLSTIENINFKRAYVRLFNKAIPYEEKYNKELHQFTYEELIDYYSTLTSISKNSIYVKHSMIKKFLVFANNESINKIDKEFLLTLVEKTRTYKSLSQIKQLCDDNFINYSDKALILLLYHAIKGKSQLEELRYLKTTDINFKLNTIILPNRTIEIKDEYTMYVLNKAIKEKSLGKYLQQEIRSSSHIYYNLDNPYVFKPKPSKKNDNGLAPLSFSSMTNRLFRLTNLIGMTVQEVYQFGICSIIDEYQRGHNKSLSLKEMEFYLKDVLKIPAVYVQEIYNIINKEKDITNN